MNKEIKAANTIGKKMNRENMVAGQYTTCCHGETSTHLPTLTTRSPRFKNWIIQIYGRKLYHELKSYITTFYTLQAQIDPTFGYEEDID